MAVTISVFNGVPYTLAAYGALQKTNTNGPETRCPFFVTLRSVNVSTFNAADSNFLRNRFTGGAYTATGLNELASGNGYTKGGKTLANARFTYASGALTFTADAVRWAATDLGIAAKSALLCYQGPESIYGNDIYYTSVPIAMIDFDMTATVGAGQSLTLNWPAAGIFKWQLA
jgi:hypothetical protein